MQFMPLEERVSPDHFFFFNKESSKFILELIQIVMLKQKHPLFWRKMKIKHFIY